MLNHLNHLEISLIKATEMLLKVFLGVDAQKQFYGDLRNYLPLEGSPRLSGEPAIPQNHSLLEF